MHNDQFQNWIRGKLDVANERFDFLLVSPLLSSIAFLGFSKTELRCLRPFRPLVPFAPLALLAWELILPVASPRYDLRFSKPATALGVRSFPSVFALEYPGRVTFELSEPGILGKMAGICVMIGVDGLVGSSDRDGDPMLSTTMDDLGDVEPMS